MSDVFICDATRTPIGRFGGALSAVRADDLAAHPLKALICGFGMPVPRSVTFRTSLLAVLSVICRVPKSLAAACGRGIGSKTPCQ